MESLSSIAVKTVLRVMRFRKPFESFDLDLDRVRKANIAHPKPGMHKGCDVDKIQGKGFSYWKLLPVNCTGTKVLIYFHGGGYVEGMVKEQWLTISKITRESNSLCLIPDYPLAPEHSFRDVFEMLGKFYREILETISSRDITFIGDSAGGGLLVSFAMYCRDNGLPMPEKLVALSPWMDLSMSNQAMAKIASKDPMLAIPGLKKAGEMYAGKENLMNYLVSPLYGDPAGLPELHLFAGTHDILYPDEYEFVRRSKEKGVNIHYYEYPSMLHCWMFLPIKEAVVTRKRIVSIL